MKTLPQLCCRCRNGDIGGKLKLPNQGQFVPRNKYNRPPVWVCNRCVQRPGGNLGFNESPIEKKVREAFQALHVHFKPQFRLGEYRYDFAIPKYKCLVEVDSWSFHRTWKQRRNDKRKDKFAKENHWRCIRLKNGPALAKRAAALIGRLKWMKAMKLADKDEETAKLIIDEGLI